MSDVVALLAFSIAGFACGWFARGGIPAGARNEESESDDPGGAALAELEHACRAMKGAPGPATYDRLQAALERAEEVDVDLERTLGADDPAYRNFERELNALISTAHRLDAPRI